MNGNLNSKGDNGEVIREKIRSQHFRDTEVELDLYLDLENEGLFRMKRVGYKVDEKYEAQIRGINKCSQITNGWIPHFAYYGGENRQEVQMASIDPKYYGQVLDVQWGNWSEQANVITDWD